MVCGCLCQSRGHPSLRSLEDPQNYVLELQLPSTLQFLSCDHGAESKDFLSSILSVKLTRISLPQRVKQNGPEACKNTFPGHRKPHWPESLICCPGARDKLLKDLPNLLWQDSKHLAHALPHLSLWQTSLINHRTLSTEPRANLRIFQDGTPGTY